MTMGDMKTPGFDDLLAGFDISDMVDPKAAIECEHDEQESHIEQHAHADDASHTPPLLMLVSALSYSEDGSKSLKGDVPPSESSSSTIIKAANAIQQQTTVVLASSLASAKGCAPRQP
ncbi:hypothetical protein MUG91_G211n12 [Manis pentadactyla]|nr:hypothetical protein MUG91_G211n12 [Manis pentadactyla]